MYGLEKQFSDRVDFFILDVDGWNTAAYMEKYLIRNRSTYVLLNAEGEEIGRWVGPLDEASVALQMEQLLSDQQ